MKKQKWLLSLILLLLIIKATPLFSQDIDFKKAINQAKTYFPHQLDKADSLVTELLVMLANHKEEKEEDFAQVCFTMGMIQLYKSRPILAEKYFNDALETKYVQEKNHGIRESCYNNLGVIFDNENKLNQALEAYIESIKIAELRADSFSIMQSWMNISMLEHRMKNLDRAVEIIKTVKEYFTRQGDTLHMGLAHLNLAEFNSDQGNRQEAVIHNKRALDLLYANNSPRAYGQALINSVSLDIDEGNYETAKIKLDSVKQLAQRNNLQDLLIFTYLVAGQNEKQLTRNYTAADAFLEKGMELAKKHKQLAILDDFYETKLDLFAKSGNYKAFSSTMSDYLSYQDEKSADASTAYHEQLKVLYELDKLKNSQSLLENKIQSKNRLLWSALLIILISLTGAIVILYLYLKNIGYVKALFRLNIKEAKMEKNHPKGMKLEIEKSFTELPAEPEVQPSKSASFNRYTEFVDQVKIKKWYLDPDISLQDMANNLGTNTKYLSQAINEFSGTNFYGILKQLRVEEARKILLHNPYDIKVKEVYHKAGFNNRYTFYKQFKEITGLSPTEFLEMAKKDDV